MANSVIGALRVDLGLNSAQFTKGLKEASGGLNKFGVQLTLGLETVANAIGRVVGAIPGAIKASIDHADALSKAAQKAGTTTEALSRLAYAASFSEVSLDDITGSLGKLSKTMVDASQNAKGPAASAFAALGIKVKDASGNLRDSNDVFTDIADRFSKLPDGATKTALAIALLGKSGAQLIPVLNEGADGLKRYADQSDRTNNTIGTKTANASNHFNDTLSEIGKKVDGLINQIAGNDGFLAALQTFADVLVSPKFETAAQELATNVVGGLTRITNAITGATNLLVTFGDKIQWISTLVPGLTGGLSKAAQAAATIKPTNSSGSPDDRNSSGGIPIIVGGHNTPDVDLGLFTNGNAADKAKKAYADVVKSANDRIAQSQVEAAALGQTAEEADRLTYSQELLSQATANGAKLTPDQIVQLNGLADSMAAAAEQTRTLTDIYDTGRGVLGSFFSDLKSDLLSGTNGWASFADAANKALDSILDKAIDVITDNVWNGLFNTILGALGGGGSSLLGLSGGSSAGLGILTPNIGHRAVGGPVRVGSPYIVGERGPEMFVPGSSGSIVPNGMLGGPPNVTINNYASDTTSASASTGSDGSLIITVDKLNAKLSADPASRTNRAQRSSFGLRNTTVKRS